MITPGSKQSILIDMQSMLEDWNQQAERYGYSGSDAFTDTGEFSVEEYDDGGEVVNTWAARIEFN